MVGKPFRPALRSLGAVQDVPSLSIVFAACSAATAPAAWSTSQGDNNSVPEPASDNGSPNDHVSPLNPLGVSCGPVCWL